MKNLLLVDDALEIRNTMSDYLSFFCEGLNIVEASNGDEALQLFRSEDFDIIVTDEMMPIMKGSQFVRACYEEIKQRKILTIVFSGQLHEDLQKQFSEMPEVKVIDKISNPQILKELIEEYETSMTS